MRDERRKLSAGTAEKIGGQKPWQYRGRDAAGKQVRRRFRTLDELEALDRRLYDEKSRHRNGLPEPQRNVTYRELVKIALDQEAGGSKWKNEMLAYSLAAFGPLQVRRIRSDEIGKWINNLVSTKKGREGDPLAKQTKQHILKVLRAVLELGVAQGFLDINPARAAAVKINTTDDDDEADTIHPFESWDEVDRVAAKAGRDGAMFGFACATGLRPEEYLALERADIDRESRQVHVRRLVVDGKVKNARTKGKGRRRSVVLTARALAYLDLTPIPLRADGLVFPSVQGKHIDRDNLASRVWHPALVAAGIAPRPMYQTRHTFATLALAATKGDLAWVAEQLGHSDLNVTRRHYARWLDSTHRDNLNKLDSAWGVSETCHSVEAAR